jgi:hypothetical protein
VLRSVAEALILDFVRAFTRSRLMALKFESLKASVDSQNLRPIAGRVILREEVKRTQPANSVKG